MPQMSPLLWSFMIIMTMSLLLITSSFLYFMTTPSPDDLSTIQSHPSLKNPSFYNWLW